MFGWFKPTCPVALTDKIWVEQRLAWIIERFGKERILSSPRVLPTREFFPDGYRGTPDDVPALFERVCIHMGADVWTFDVTLFTEADRPDVSGLYARSADGRPKIWLLDSLLPDQEAVIATMAHEVAHDLLLGAGLLTGDESDHEQLTDLLPVALGMGTFHANTAIKQTSGYTAGWSYWSIRRSGYLTASVCGYAMGVIEWLRNSNTRLSTDLLGDDAATAMRLGRKFLHATGDCLINRDAPATLSCLPGRVASFADVSESASHCLFTLQTWMKSGSPNSSQLKTAIECLKHKLPEIQVAAIQLLTLAADPPVELIDSILDRLAESEGTVQREILAAIVKLKVPAHHVTNRGDKLIEELVWMTKSDNPDVAHAAAVVLGTYGKASLEAIPRLLPLLVRALIRSDESAEPLLNSVQQIVDDVPAYLSMHPRILSEPHQELIHEFLLAKRLVNRRGLSRHS
jgi:hypothetical protein